MNNERIGSLRAWLEQASPGLEGLVGPLSRAWDCFRGSDQAGMKAGKLRKRNGSRIESPSWKPPVLEFVIERHGGVVSGSKLAPLQTWRLDLDAQTAEVYQGRSRVVRPREPRLDVRRLATEIASVAALRGASTDPRIEMRPNGGVLIIVGAISELTDGAKQTRVSRRRRFRVALHEAMREAGFRPDPAARGPRAEYMFLPGDP
jgi:hypothetical protein